MISLSPPFQIVLWLIGWFALFFRGRGAPASGFGPVSHFRLARSGGLWVAGFKGMRFKEVTNRGFGQGLRWLGLVLVLGLGLGQATAGVWTSHDGTVFTSFEEQVAYDEAHAAATMLHWLEYEEALGDRQAYGLFQFNPHAGHGATWQRENLEFTIVESFGGLNYTLGADGVVRLDPVYVRIRVVTVDIDHGVAMWREVTSIGIALLPVVGTAEAVVQLFTGMDSITGEVVDPWLAGLGVMASFIPGGRVVLKGGATAARAATAAENAGSLRRFVRQDEFDAIQVAIRNGDESVNLGRWLTPDKITDPRVAGSQLAAPGVTKNPFVGYVDVPVVSLPRVPLGNSGPRLVQPFYDDFGVRLPGGGVEVEYMFRPTVPTKGLNLVPTP
jgi:hypothetical protein